MSGPCGGESGPIMGLCRPCNDALQAVRVPRRAARPERMWFPSTDSLYESFAGGCQICSRLIRQIPDEQRQKLHEVLQAKSSSPTPDKLYLEIIALYGGDVEITLDRNLQDKILPHGGRRGDTPAVSITLTDFVDDAKQQEVRPGWIASNLSNGEDTFSKMRVWLQTCAETHETCRHRRQEQDKKWLPKRLIEIKSSTRDGAQSMACRVVDTQKEKMHCPSGYVTMSHQWASQSLPILTETNLPLWQNGLPLETFPEHFLDAFEVALRLNIPHVWIDSICIIQAGDNKAD